MNISNLTSGQCPSYPNGLGFDYEQIVHTTTTDKNSLPLAVIPADGTNSLKMCPAQATLVVTNQIGTQCIRSNSSGNSPRDTIPNTENEKAVQISQLQPSSTPPMSIPQAPSGFTCLSDKCVRISNFSSQNNTLGASVENTCAGMYLPQAVENQVLAIFNGMPQTCSADGQTPVSVYTSHSWTIPQANLVMPLFHTIENNISQNINLNSLPCLAESQAPAQVHIPHSLQAPQATPNITHVGEQIQEIALPVIGVIGFAIFSFLTYKTIASLKRRNMQKAQAKAQEEKIAAEKAKLAAEQADLLAKQQAHDAAIKAQFIQKQEAVLSTHRHNDTILSGLGIEHWHIPLKGPDGKIIEGTHAITDTLPENLVYNTKTKNILSVISSMFEQSNKTLGSVALPNILIQGETGSGKTTLVNNLLKKVTEAGAGYIYIPNDFFENHLAAGSHVDAFHTLLNVADTTDVPVYLVIENGEFLFKQRSNESSNSTENRRVDFLNAVLDLTGDSHRKVSVLMTTSDPTITDEAFNTRVMPIAPGLLGVEERRKIIGNLAAKFWNNDEKAKNFFNLSRVEKMAIATEGFSYTQLNELMDKLYNSKGKVLDQGAIDSNIELLKIRSGIINQKG